MTDGFAINVLKELVAIDSTVNTGEYECASKVKDIFSSFGVNAEVDAWDGRRANVEAVIKGKDSKGGLMFASHLDVVEADAESWQSEPFKPVIRDNRLFGRGTVDMKGGMAAVIAAMKELVEEGREFKRDVIFAATAGEELDSVGAFRYLEKRESLKGNLTGIIVPEPTSMGLKIAHKGILWLEITFKGKPAHGSMPHLGVNAIENAFKLHAEMKKLGLETISDKTLGSCSMSCNKMNAGVAANIVPDECKVCYDIRLIHGVNKEDVIDKVKALIDKFSTTDNTFNASISIARYCPALYTDPENDFVRKVAGILNSDIGVVSFTTDSPYFASLEAPVVVIGPGDSGMCHQVDESLEIEELEKTKKLYRDIITQVCC